MATYKTSGIIIKRTNLREADRILTIYTQEHGKIRAVAKGVRKTLSKLAGNLELFCLDKLLIAEGRNLDIIAEVENIKCYFSLRSNLRATHMAYYLAEIVDQMTLENQSHPSIFDLLEQVLEGLSSQANRLLIPFFEINFLSESGFKPELYQCLNCGKKIIAQKNYFSFSSGGLVCGVCQASDQLISNQAIKVLRLFLKNKATIVNKISLENKLIKEIEELTSNYLKYFHQKEFNARRFI